MNVAKALPLVLAMYLLASPAAAAEKAWLKGLKTVKVDVTIAQALIDLGITQERLKTKVELQLRKGGLKVDNSLEEPTFSIELNAVNGPGTDAYACYVSVVLLENVKVVRNDESLNGIVWGPNLYVFYLVHSIEEELFGTTGDKVDEFLNDWLEANPK